MSNDPIAHHVVLDAGVATAFDAFTTHLGAWWPIAYTFSGADFVSAGVEPRAGGVWFERNGSGERVSWGDVRAYVPVERLVLAFAIGADRKPTSHDAASEVEVRFAAAGPGRTRVDVEHRDFSRHGQDAGTLRAGMDSAQGWPLIVAELRRWMRARPAVRYIVAGVDAAAEFYTSRLGFTVDMAGAPGFAALSRGALRLYLNEPGAGGGGSAAGGRPPEPGGWNRLQIEVADLEALMHRLRRNGSAFRTDLIEGRGGKQLLLEDPSGNPIELFEPHRPS